MNIEEFYQEKRKQHKKLVKALVEGVHKDQPELVDWTDPETDEPTKVPVAVYLTSVKKFETGTTDGSVCLVSVFDHRGQPLAAERLAAGTHRVATPEEIKKYLQRQIDQKRMHDAMDVRREQKTMKIVSQDSQTMPAHLQQLAEEQLVGAGKGGKK